MNKCLKCENIIDTVDICVNCINQPIDDIDELHKEIEYLESIIIKLKAPKQLPYKLNNGSKLDKALYGMEDAMKAYTEKLRAKTRAYKA